MTRGTPSEADKALLATYGKVAQFDSPLYHSEEIPLPLSLQAAVKPIIEMLAVVQARLRKIEKLVEASQPHELCDTCDEMADHFYCSVCIEATTNED